MTAQTTQYPPDAVLSDFGLGKLDAASVVHTVAGSIRTMCGRKDSSGRK